MVRFDLGQVLATPGVLRAAEASGDDLVELLARHARGDYPPPMYSWVRVVPDLGSATGFTLDTAVTGQFNAREANSNPGVPRGTIVKMTFLGYDEDDQPVYVFTCSDRPADPFQPVPPHDHRDLVHGGFAFSCYHPGTGLPQMPWAI